MTRQHGPPRLGLGPAHATQENPNEVQGQAEAGGGGSGAGGGEAGGGDGGRAAAALLRLQRADKLLHNMYGRLASALSGNGVSKYYKHGGVKGACWDKIWFFVFLNVFTLTFVIAMCIYAVRELRRELRRVGRVKLEELVDDVELALLNADGDANNLDSVGNENGNGNGNDDANNLENGNGHVNEEEEKEKKKEKEEKEKKKKEKEEKEKKKKEKEQEDDNATMKEDVQARLVVIVMGDLFSICGTVYVIVRLISCFQ